jgi:diguanylate cyclase (GGDEF)-like protein
VQECPVAAEVERLRSECEVLTQQSQTDPLTGLFNFRYLMTALEREMERTRRTGLPIGLIMVDLDHFKKVNDTYGHQAGNEALQWASNVWRNNLRRIDIPCRYGGEEFAIVLPGVRLSQALVAAERLRSVLANTPAVIDGRDISLTASFGVEVFSAKDNLSAHDLIKRADDFLREAKAKGRNRVCYEEDKVTSVPTEVTKEERAALFIGRWPKISRD